MRKQYDNTPVSITEDNRKESVKILNNLIMSMDMLRGYVKEGSLRMNELSTHMSLAEAYVKDLSKLLNYDLMLAKEYEERFAEIKEKNTIIHNLKEQLGKSVTPDVVAGAINFYENIFRGWYENEGFHFGSVKGMWSHGMTVELTSQMDYSRKRSGNDVKDPLWKDKDGIEAKIKEGWNIHKDKYSAELLDTDNNKGQLFLLLKHCFPNVRINKFTGRQNDYGTFSLNTEIFVSYQDLYDYYNKINKKEDSPK